MALKHYVTHVGIGLDASYSMDHLSSKLIEVVDAQIKHLAQQSRDMNQEVRVSVYSFSSRGTVKCLCWDMDVLRFDTINGLYKVSGRTALLDCAHTMLDDFATIPVKYDDHAHVLYWWSDGMENDSVKFMPEELSKKINAQPDYVTVAFFAPHQEAKQYAINCGFPANNIEIWDATSVKGVENVGRIIRDTNTAFLQGRTSGIKSYKSGLFSLNTLTVADILSLTAIPSSHYKIFNVTDAVEDIKPFVERNMKRFATYGYTFQYYQGCSYYELTKTEHIQPSKGVAVLYNGQLYSGPEARTALGLPDSTVKVDPKAQKYQGYSIFVQSKSVNRKLIPGQRVLVLTGNIVSNIFR